MPPKKKLKTEHRNQDNILSDYREQLTVLTSNPEFNLTGEARNTINIFTQQINSAIDESNVAHILSALITNWRGHHFNSNNDIIYRMLNLWRDISDQDIGALYEEYFELTDYLHHYPALSQMSQSQEVSQGNTEGSSQEDILRYLGEIPLSVYHQGSSEPGGRSVGESLVPENVGSQWYGDYDVSSDIEEDAPQSNRTIPPDHQPTPLNYPVVSTASAETVNQEYTRNEREGGDTQKINCFTDIRYSNLVENIFADPFFKNTDQKNNESIILDLDNIIPAIGLFYIVLDSYL